MNGGGEQNQGDTPTDGAVGDERQDNGRSDGGGLTGAGQAALGPLDYIIKMGIRAHPAVRYGVAVLGLLAIGVAMFRITSGVVVDTDGVRTIVIIVLMLLALMLLFFMFANAVDSENKIALWTNRIIGAFLPIFFLIGIGWAGWLGFTEKDCELALLVKGAEAAKCDNLPPRIEGSVLNVDDDQQFVSGAQVVLRRGLATTLTTNEAGDFTHSFNEAAIGKEVQAYARKDGYQRAETLRVKLLEGVNELEIKLKPLVSSGSASTQERFKYIPEKALQPKLNPTRLDEGEIYAGAGMAGPVQPQEGRLRIGAFNGQDWKYDIFYCQSPVGNTIKSKILATQLKTILEAQNGVRSVRVRVWPVRRAGYDLATGADANIRSGEKLVVLLNTRPEREIITRQLKGLWSPYLENGEIVGSRNVTTSYPDYMSIVACRS